MSKLHKVVLVKALVDPKFAKVLRNSIPKESDPIKTRLIRLQDMKVLHKSIDIDQVALDIKIHILGYYFLGPLLFDVAPEKMENDLKLWARTYALGLKG